MYCCDHLHVIACWNSVGVAFIHQDDHFFSMLSVEETLHLAATLRTIKSNVDIHNHTHVLKHNMREVMNNLALHNVAKSFIGQ